MEWDGSCVRACVLLAFMAWGMKRGEGGPWRLVIDAMGWDAPACYCFLLWRFDEWFLYAMRCDAMRCEHNGDFFSLFSRQEVREREREGEREVSASVR